MTARFRLSVIICCYNMRRELPRTILSATVPYQQEISPSDFELIIVDNGSTDVMPDEWVAGLPSNAVFVQMPLPTPSPARAMNWAARTYASGDVLLFAIDGARILSNRLYSMSLEAHRLIRNAFVYTLAWHLGSKRQVKSVLEGYDQHFEDNLISGSGWPREPDRIFDIAVFAGSSSRGFFQPIAESNAFSVGRALYENIGGFDERFTSPGGGLCNLEIFERYTLHPQTVNICLLTEGTFHQIHSGVATSGKIGWSTMADEYERVRGRKYRRPQFEPLYFGRPAGGVSRFVHESIDVV
jgi:glycosyltransferase involved in cell wall biosynthesis